MPQLFPAWSDTALRLVLTGALAVILSVVVLPMVFVRTPYAEGRGYPHDQPVQFDHRHHFGDDEIDCLYCHSSATRAATAGIPASSLCMGCHSQIWNNSILLEPLRRAYAAGVSLPWLRVHRLPDFVYFDHSAHTTHGVGCVTCHSRVDQMALVHQVAPLSMGWCLDCHRNPGPSLRPLSQLTSMTWEPPAGEEAALASRLVSELGVLSLTSCTSCHR